MTLDNKNPLDYLKNHKMTAQTQSNGCTLYRIQNDQHSGSVYTYPLYPGVNLISASFQLESITIAEASGFNRLLINYCIDGRCEVDLGSNRFLFLEPGYLSIDSNPARNSFKSPTGNYSGVEILFDFNILQSQLPAVFEDLDITPGLIKDKFCSQGQSYIAKAPEAAAAIFNGIFNNPDAPLSKNRMDMFLLLQQLKNIAPGLNPIQMKWLTKGQIQIARTVERHITNNLNTKYCVSQMAEEFGISPSSLKNYFQSVYGKPVSTYLRGKRMMTAETRLRESDLSINDIASSVGYENQSKFSAAFKRHNGYSPLEYRRISRIDQMEVTSCRN